MRWALGDLVLDSTTYDVRRGEEVVAIEPRVFDLLAYLLEHRDRVVSKDELLLEVWQGQYVGETALTRCVYEVRRALGDDAERQELIKTVYGRGYQFVGAVDELPTEEALEVPAPVPLSSPGVGGLSKAWLGLPLLVLFGWWAVGAARDATEAAAPSAPSSGVESAESPPGTVERLLIVPFAADDAANASGLVGFSVSDQVWYQLSSQPGLVVRALEVGSALEAAELTPIQMLDEGQVDAVVTGRLAGSALEGRSQLTVRLHEKGPAGEPRVLTVGTYEVADPTSAESLDRFLRVRNAIAADVVEHLAPTLVSRDTAGVTPRDPEALRLYLQARERFATISCGDADILLDLLDRSLQLDPDFAVAWVAKGYALYSQSWSCGREAAFAEEALEAARRAHELAPELPGALLLQVTLLVEAGEVEAAYALLLDGWDSIGTSPLASLARAYALTYAGFLDPAAESIREALAIDPLVLAEFSVAPTCFLYRGEYERFLEYLPASDTPADRYYRGLALARLGRVDDALEILEPAFRLNPSDLFARFASALTSILEGEEATGLEIVRGIVRQRTELGTLDGEMTFKEAKLLAWSGSGREALGRLEAAVDMGFFCPRCLQAEPVFAPWGEIERYQAVLERAKDRHRQFASRFGLTPEG